MVKIVINSYKLTDTLKERLFKRKYMVHVEICSPELWEELLEAGLDVDDWSEKNYGNKIYLIKPSK
jgi:hypothetical protein